MWKNALGERKVSEELNVFSGTTICGMTSRSADYVKT
jgi:hypothetical protein